MNRRSFAATAVAWLAAMFGLRKSGADGERTVQLPYDPEARDNSSSTRLVFVTLDGTEYTLPFDGVKIVNTTGRSIPAGTLLYFELSPLRGGSSKTWQHKRRESNEPT
jgi:hypothetical protein